MPDAITIKQVVTAWGRDTDQGGRAAVLRLRYRVRGDDWGHPGASKNPTRLLHPTLTGDQVAAAGICVRLLAAGQQDQVYLAVPKSLAGLLTEIRKTGRAEWMPESIRGAFDATLPLLKSATIEERDRRTFRNLHKLVADTRPDSSFQSLETAMSQVQAGLTSRDGTLEPVSVTEPGWTCDWGRSRKYGGAAVGLVLTSADGDVADTPKVIAVPTPPDLIDGELAGVLLANAYARIIGERCRVVYSDSRDTPSHLRIFVESGRPPTYGAVLTRLAAPFTDEELLGIDVRWIYRHSTPAHRVADVAARHMSRGELVPEESVIDLEWLLGSIG